MFEQSLYTVTILTILAYMVLRIEGHGRMMEPPSRMSAYLAGFPTPKNYEDHQMNCGGFSLQWDKNGGRCGICGDPWSGPRMYERPGGFYVKGPVVITQTYEENQSIKVSIQLTQNHKGWFEFRLCDIRTSGGVEADQACLDRHLLADDTGRTRFDSPTDNSGLFDFYLVLPPGLTCPQCLLQWKWKCGNNWGCDETGCGTGKGERQEEFYACADIKIEPRGGSLDNSQPLPPPQQPSQPKPYPLQPQQPQKPAQPFPQRPQQPQQPLQPQPYPIQPRQPVQPQPSQPISKGRLEIPEGFSTYSEYLQNMFATMTNNALVFANKIRVSAGGVKRSRLPARSSSNPAKEVYDRQFLREVVGYPSRWQQQSYSYRGIYSQPVGLPSWLNNQQPLADQDSVDRLCAACHNGCRFSACGWHCSRQCLH